MTGYKGKWKIISEHIYESFPIFTLKKSIRENPLTGTQIDFVRVDGLDWVNVIAFTPKNELVLVKQYRHGAEEYTLELPGGCIEKEAPDPQENGMRELVEETGYTSNEVDFLGMLRPNPAMYSMKNYFFVAKNCRIVSQQALDSGEDIEIILKPFTEVINEIKTGTFNHGMCTAGLGLYCLKYQNFD
jgi:ADP-ribose pyrophosphatase